jgi:hypothetical protein
MPEEIRQKKDSQVSSCKWSMEILESIHSWKVPGISPLLEENI